MLPKIVYTYTGYRLYDFPVELVAEIKDSLTFPNPKYAAAAQYSKWGKSPKNIPRELWYYKIRCNYIEVPYGFEVNDFLPVNFEISERPEVRNKVTFSPFKLELRKTQQEAFNAYFDSLNKRMNFSQIVLNTGKGKSILGLAIAAKLSVRTLIIVHKSDLVRGWQEDIAKSLEMPVGIIQSTSQKVEDITIATVQTLNSRIKSGAYSPSFFKQFDLIIVDEAHHCPASTYDIINKFQARYRLGLTATPERNDGLTHVLNLFFGRPCYVYKSGVEDDDILPVKVFTRNVPLYYNPLVKIVSKNDDVVSIELADEFRKSPTAQDNRGKRYFTMSELRGLKIDFPPNFNRATMERNIVNHEVTFNEVLKDLSGEVDKGKSCILFFKQKEEVDYWFDKLSAEFYRSGKYFRICKYYGDNSDDENKRVLEEIEKGYYKITLATLAKCGEGTNCRAWESVFLISSIANGKDVEQAIGRARRIKRGKSDIVNVFDYRFPDVSGLNLRSHGSTRDERYKELNFDYPRKEKFSFSFGYPDKK